MGPDVQIDPSIKNDVQEAVNELRKSDPSFFKGVSKIVGLTGGPFGQVESKDPTVIHVNLPRIKQEVQSQMGSAYNANDPKHKEYFKEALKRAIVETISHEKGHLSDYDPEHSKFPGGEGVAEQSEKTMMQRLNYDKPLEFQASLNKHKTAQSKKEEFSKALQDLVEQWPEEAMEGYERDAAKIMSKHTKTPQLPNIGFEPGEKVSWSNRVPIDLGDPSKGFKEVWEIGTIANPNEVNQELKDLNKTMKDVVYIKDLDGNIYYSWAEDLTKVAQVGAEPSSSGKGYMEYNLTGNDYMAGGPNAVPMSTRLQELLKKYKKKLKK